MALCLDAMSRVHALSIFKRMVAVALSTCSVAVSLYLNVLQCLASALILNPRLNAQERGL